LAYPKPAEDLPYPTGVWHYARGLAFASLGQLAKAQVELDALRVIVADERLESITVWEINSAKSLMQIAERLLTGKLTAERRQWTAAIAALKEAVALQDEQNYDEPPSWYTSTRNVLGAVYLKAGRPKAAEKVYREDLEVFPRNGWALFGLAQALSAQGRRAEAAQVTSAFKQAWTRADVALPIGP
jgi:tetratricopeptide (TPR) repeat protein